MGSQIPPAPPVRTTEPSGTRTFEARISGTRTPGTRSAGTRSAGTRLSAPPEQMYAPFVRAQGVEDTTILWLPVSGFPMRFEEKRWILAFLRRFAAALEGQCKLRQEVFVQYATATSAACVDRYRAYTQRCQFLLGLSRSPGEDLAGIPEADSVAEEVKGGKGIDMAKWTSDYAIWFQNKGGAEQETIFLGEGGLTSIFLPPDPRTKAPALPFTPKMRAALPAFQRFNVDAALAGVMALNDRFLPRSKEVFGEGIEIDLATVGFILPRLDSGHLIAATPEDRATWFQLFDVYIRESPRDKGLLLAFQKDLLPLLREAVDQLAVDGLEYPLAVKRGQAHA